MSDASHYVIRGGIEGRERLRILARVMRPTTVALLERLALEDGLACLDVGCGGGDVTLEIASRVAPRGRAVGLDMDETQLGIARAEALERGAANVEFRTADARESIEAAAFDVVYARFLLTHLSDPAAMARAFFAQLRPGGVVAVEDIDFNGNFVWPDSPAFRRYHEIYCEVVRRRGGDASIGPRLPRLLCEAGFEDVDVHVVQPMGLRGDVKRISPITMENIAEAVVREGLASREEVSAIAREMYEFAEDPTTLAGVPRIVQAWGRRSGRAPLLDPARSRSLRHRG